MATGRDNLLAVLNRADSVDIAEGLVAYYRYREVMVSLGEYYGYSVETVTAVFAATSPNNDYVKNLRSTATLLAGHRAGLGIESLTVSTYGHCGRRAWRYLTGEADFLGTVKGKKIRAFYQNILNPLDPEPVTIDGHAVNAWRGKAVALKKVASGKFDYEEVAQDYRLVARKRGMLPHQLQAIIWFAWKRINRILYNGQLGFFHKGDAWKTLIRPEEIKVFGEKKKEMHSKGLQGGTKGAGVQILFPFVRGEGGATEGG